METKKTEYEKMKEHYQSRLEDVKILLELEIIENEAPTIYDKLRDDYGEINDYGLSMDYADFSESGGITNDHTERFFRYQFSYGGPQEEIRIYSSGRVDFWYLDWGTGEHCDGSEFNEFIEYVTGLTVSEIAEKVLHFCNTGEVPE